MVERFQPYQGFRMHPLLSLVYWSNMDKHREAVRVNTMGMFGPLPIAQANAAVPAYPPPDSPQMDVKVARSFQVLLFDGTDVEDAEKALTEILTQVEKIVDHFDSVLR
jgi:hypothetical protein